MMGTLRMFQVREISACSTQQCYESKTALKNQIFSKNTRKFERETMKDRDKFYILVH